MTREIKFRVWSKENEIMLEWSDLLDAPDFEEFMRFADKEDAHYSKLMQYTGLKDSKGVEIYEGDIVEVNHHESDKWKWRETVIFHLSCFMVGDEDLLSNLIPDIEVIGNIYESEEQQ